MAKVNVVEICDHEPFHGRFLHRRSPVSVGATEAGAKQAAERHFAQRERQAPAEWTRRRCSPSLLSRGWEAAEQVVHRW